MEIRFLGTNNTPSRDSSYTCFLVDEKLAVDAGSVASALTLDEQRKIEAVLVSHGHFDHIRELPSLAFNNAFSRKVIKVFGSKETLELFYSRLSDGKIYPDFVRGSKDFEKNVLELHEVRPLETFVTGAFDVLPVAIPHAASSLGFQISTNGKTVFYTSDTGPGLSEVWQKVSPQLLITELTLPDRMQEFARESRHLCPKLLREELDEFKRQKGYLPRVLAAHRNPEFEAEIEHDIKDAFTGLQVDIDLARTAKTFTV